MEWECGVSRCSILLGLQRAGGSCIDLRRRLMEMLIEHCTAYCKNTLVEEAFAFCSTYEPTQRNWDYVLSGKLLIESCHITHFRPFMLALPNYRCVPRCTNRNNHLYPSDTALQLKWRVAIKRANKNGTLWMPNLGNDVVCHSHFKADDYSKTRTVKRLTLGAIPSVFPFNLLIW